MDYYLGYGPNRLICSVLEEMRKCHETRNYSYLPGLIEEAQTLANRMESKLSDSSDLEHMEDTRKKLKKELKALRAELSEAKSERGGE